LYNFVKKVPVIALVLLLTACGSGVQVTSIDKSYSTETIEVDAKIPQISGLTSEDFEKEINSEYKETVTELLEEFKEQATKTGDKSTFKVETTEHYNNDGFFSVVTNIESSAANSHKNCYRIAKNIDTYRNCEVSLSDLFMGEDYIDMINSRLEETVKENGDKYSDLWEQPRLSENQEFYISGDSLVIYYPPYELSYYERGFVEIPLKLSDMRGYLKEEYRYLAEKNL